MGIGPGEIGAGGSAVGMGGAGGGGGGVASGVEGREVSVAERVGVGVRTRLLPVGIRKTCPT